MDDFTYQYLPWRGIFSDSFRKYGALSKVSNDGAPLSIGFDYQGVATKVRSVKDKHFYWVGSPKAGLFGSDKFEPGIHRWVCITEGELDAISCWQAFGRDQGCDCVSVQSSSTGVRDCVAMRSFLNAYERIYLFFDADAPGRELTKDVARLFDYQKVYHIRPNNRKDANDYLQAGDTDGLRSVFLSAKQYVPETIVCSFEEFREILSDTGTGEGVPYPWPTLNGMTYGIRKGEIVLLTALEGIGKTEVTRAIEYQLLKETDDGIGAIFLEEGKRHHLEALAGLELGAPIHLPDHRVSPSTTAEALEKVVRQDGRLHIYSHFGSDDPEVLLDTIRYMVTVRNVGYVLLDHVSMVVSGLEGEDERRVLDYLTTRLGMMVQELSFALIMVSHVNDEGKTRGSRYISKIAHTWISLSRDIIHPDPTVQNTTYLTVMKNRFGAKAGPAGQLKFDTRAWKYTEVSDGRQDQTFGQWSPV